MSKMHEKLMQVGKNIKESPVRSSKTLMLGHLTLLFDSKLNPQKDTQYIKCCFQSANRLTQCILPKCLDLQHISC